MAFQTNLHEDAKSCTKSVLVKNEEMIENKSHKNCDLTKMGFEQERKSSPQLVNGILKIKSEPFQQDNDDSSLSSNDPNEVLPDGIDSKVNPSQTESDSKTTITHSTQQQSSEKERESIDVKSIENDAKSGQSKEKQISLKRTLSPTNGKYHIPMYNKIQVQETEPAKLTHEKSWMSKEIQKEHCSLGDYEHIRNYPTLFYPPTKDRTDFLNYDKVNNRLQAHMRSYGQFDIPPEYRAALYDKFYQDSLKTRLLYMPTSAMEASALRISEEAYIKAYNDEIMHRVHQSQFGSAFKKPINYGERVPKGLKNHEPEMNFFNQYPTQERDFEFKRAEGQTQLLGGIPEDLEYRTHGSTFFMMQPKLDMLYKERNARRLKDHEELNYGFTLAERPYASKSPIFQDKPHQEARCSYPCCTNAATHGDIIKDRHLEVVSSPPLSMYAPLHPAAMKREFQGDNISRTVRNSSFEKLLSAEREAIMRKQNMQNGEEERACAQPQIQNEVNQISDEKSANNSAWKYNKDGTEIYKQANLDGKTSTSTNNPQSRPSPGVDKLTEKETNAKTEGNFQQAKVNVATTEKPLNQECEPAQKKISCSVCNKTFNRTSNLYTHMRTHSAHKPHACEFCGKRFHQKADLRIHRYIHTGEKPHKCTKCGRGFKQLTHLKYHMRTHSDIRMYKCPYCEKGFNQKSNLQAHIFGHTGQRPHKCDVCGKGFTLASTLNTHKRTHLPNKPFKCQFCERAFYQKNALKMHYVSTHPYSSGAV